MLLGTHSNSIDAKGRCVIPAGIRPDLGKSCMLVKGPESCLYIYTAEDYLDYVKTHILNRPDDDEDVRLLRTSYFYNSKECEIDKQGRINFPQEFLDHAHVKKEIVFIGTIDRVELWAREFLENKMTDGKMEPGRLLGKMSKFREKSDRE